MNNVSFFQMSLRIMSIIMMHSNKTNRHQNQEQNMFYAEFMAGKKKLNLRD